MEEKEEASEQQTGSESESASLTPSLPPPSQQQQQQQQQPQVTAVVGPRCAPTYSVVNAIIEKKEDGPGPRCGHTLTAVPAVGEEGTSSYIGPRLILFGGATALEGNSGGTGTPTSSNVSYAGLAGATADVHCYDVLSNKWSRLTPYGEPPSPRAAHVATAVGTMVVIQGGIGPAGLSAEDLHVLDLTQQRPRWHRVVVQGPGPGPRYGHVMALVGQRYLMPLASAYGLAKHRDGRWEWAIAPGVSPSARYQHAAVFVNARLHVSGGALGGGRMVEDSSSVAGVLLDDLLVAEDLAAAETTSAASHAAAAAAATNTPPGRSPGRYGFSDERTGELPESAPDAVVLGSPVAPPATPSGKPSLSLIKPDSAVPNSVIPAGVRLHHRAVTHLLKPRGWKPPVRRQFFLDCNEIADLCDSAERIFSSEPTVLQLKAPIKIFGDLHGQFGDLMRLFDEYGSPSTAGDISYIDYLFLGDYVDRGQHSLETITLLLALKVEYQHNVHLIRGNHEAADINALFGFRIECIERMGERDGIWVWHRINRLFNWLPLAALIEKKIICMHGGIGRSINHVEQIENIQRPITMEAGSIVLMDLLWSDPTENDSVEGLRPNARGPGLVTFGPDRVMEFCNNNDLQLIVRAHECVMDGFERFAQGHLITLFSATNYCGTANNAGAILVLGRDLVVVPKLIHPLPPAITSPETSPERHIEDTWMQVFISNRY
nr:putative phosphoprotein phosphatase [Arabidopsis thaliana]